MIRAGLTLVLSLLMTLVHAEGIEGSGERYGFVPGQQILYESDLANCPVGEFLAELKSVRGGYECARYRDRMWVRPLEHGTTLYLALPRPLPEAFSVEFVVHSFPEGRPALRFALHPAALLPRLRNGDAYAAGDAQLAGGVIRVGEPSLFGAQESATGKLEGRWQFRSTLAPGKDHHIAIQVRRKQIRFYVDGKRVGHTSFTPDTPPQVLTFYVRRVVDAPQPFAEAPVLIRDIRIAAYTEQEARPEAEKDLVRDLGAVETPEGLKVTLSEAVLFDFGQWSLKPEATGTLTKLARLANLRKGIVRIEGHTDDVGSEQFNRVLSYLRAHVVALELARLGVDASRLHPVGFGETRPVAPNDSERNRALNRRVEVILTRSDAP